MTSKPPPSVAEFPEESLEKLAYSLVSEIQTQEPNDRNRLGYNVWIWLKERKGTLKQAVINSGSRTYQPIEEVYEVIKDGLQQKGITIS